MQDIYRMLARLMQTELPSLISAESGTGGARGARAARLRQSAAKAPFVAVKYGGDPREA